MSVGINETIEVLEAIAVLKKVLVKYLADGFQVEDIVKIVEDLLANDEAKKEIGEALEGIEKVLPELQDLSWSEKITLLQKAIAIIL